MTSESRWLTSEQAAELMGISANALEVRRHRGTSPPFIKASDGGIIYEQHQVEAWTNEQRENKHERD